MLRNSPLLFAGLKTMFQLPSIHEVSHPILCITIKKNTQKENDLRIKSCDQERHVICQNSGKYQRLNHFFKTRNYAYRVRGVVVH